MSTLERKPEPPRNRRGRYVILCNLFHHKAHGGHTYIRGDAKTCCPGIARTQEW